MQQKTIMTAGFALLAAILSFSFYNMGQSLAAERFGRGDHDLDHEFGDEYEHNDRRAAAVADPTYAAECGSCHMAYPAGLLPAASWRRIMTGLDDHFGENAELDTETRQAIEDYLVRGSTRAPYRKLFRNLGDAAPSRITELPYFVHEHDEIPARFVGGNDQVGSFSQCNACHRGAEQGRFDEDDVTIPGVGRWDD